jgi:Mrp family chromosome partitioning ATPase
VVRPTASVLEAARAAAGVPLEAIEALAHDLAAAGEGARRITVIGTLRNVGTTMAAITLARSLGKEARVALVDLALGSPNLSVIAADPTAPGIAELVGGSASFGQIITRDRFSRVHLIMAGREPVDPSAIKTSQRLSITLEALARSYDHVVIDAGTVGDVALDRFANLAPRAVLVAGELDDPATVSARERLLQAGFADVNVLVGAPRGPEIGAKAAA